MNVYDLLNITGVDVENSIKEAIIETKEELKNLTTLQTCIIYSNYINKNLSKRHIINKIINTKDYNFLYAHQFNLVMIDENYFFLIDLCFSQFQDTTFKDLSTYGYMKIEKEKLINYLQIVGQEKKQIDIDNLLDISKKVK